ncbi:hypothetical protein M231_04700 [Tremella mesenterica]|uniref:Uncharacterized protein n=1 Tax=Tremella mesenterica TaxID=5217 RepID=A0A4Q1BJV4_TREME|nr:hypothetical protein M231_04700 [Tremella mesenterica]
MNNRVISAKAFANSTSETVLGAGTTTTWEPKAVIMATSPDLGSVGRVRTSTSSGDPVPFFLPSVLKTSCVRLPKFVLGTGPAGIQSLDLPACWEGGPVGA